MIFILETAEKENNENHCNSASNSEILTNSNSSETLNKNPPDDTTNSNKKNESNTLNEDSREKVEFKVIYNKKKIDITFALDGTVGELKEHLQNVISVPQAMQKIMFKGLAKDDQTLRNLGVTTGKKSFFNFKICKNFFYLKYFTVKLGAKVMIVGSKLDDVLAVSIPTKQELSDEAAGSASKEPISQQKLHRKILDKGVPDDVMPGILETQVLIFELFVNAS